MLTIEKALIRLDGFEMQADLTVEHGRLVAVLGPSGAGKSTLLCAIAGFQNLARGTIRWQGEQMAHDPAQRPITMVFQDNNLFPHLSVAQNIGLGLRANLRLSRAENAQVEAALERVELVGMGGRKPAQLSGGQVARVALARVLLRKRPLVLLDEPFGALGPALRAEMLSLMRDLAQETKATLLMVTHTPQDARLIADQVVLVAQGRAHSPVPTQQIFDSPPEALRDYLGA